MKRIHFTNTSFLIFAHLMGALGVVYMAAIHFSWWTLILAVAWLWACGIAITAGYHRLFAHRSYRSAGVVKALFLFFGAGAVQNSALRWAADHRVHHAKTDTPRDPYSIRRGVWWAHVGWVLTKSRKRSDDVVKDLRQDKLVWWQHKLYVPLAFLAGAIVPAGLGALWGDAMGGLLVGGFTRLIVQWHCTFSINSLAHLIGRRPYDKTSTARDSHVTALVSFGEGYHNFHHAFQADYRNGVRWFDFDPAKWLIWCLQGVNLTWDLRRTPAQAIARAKARAQASMTSTVA